MTRIVAPTGQARLLQKRRVLAKRYNHWELIVERLAATPLEDRIGDLPAAQHSLDEVGRQLTELDRALGLNLQWSRGCGQRGRENSRMVKRSLVIDGRKTSVSLEGAFWRSFEEIADERRLTLAELAHEIRVSRRAGKLSSAIRLFVLAYHRDLHARDTANVTLSP